MTKAGKSPDQVLAREIQAATGKAYMVCLSEAQTLLDPVRRISEECGDRLGDMMCVLRPGPHPGWRHLDDLADTWWDQSHEFPYSNTPVRCPACMGILLSPDRDTHLDCEPDPRREEEFLRSLNQGRRN